MQLTKEQVQKVAKLANLPIGSEEKEKFTEQLSKILEYVEQLEAVDTEHVKPLFNVAGKENILREDIVTTSLTQNQALENSTGSKDGYFVTKGVLEGE